MRIHIALILFGILECNIYDAFAKANCPRISGVPGLRVRYRGRGRVAKFRCRRKFKVIGSKMSVCINNKWTHPTPFCASTKCPKLVVSNTVDTTITLGGAMVRFHCSPGRVLRGNDTMYCAIDKTWVGTVPTCIRQAVETECDFELPNLCGWSQDKTDDFDWVMGTRRTPTASTGPDRDHTFGHGDYGHYMYVESSSPRTYGDVARFLSPIYDKTDEGLCFEFWYHLKGPIGTNLTGDLKLYILQEGGTLPDPTNSSFTPSFSIQGNQGDNWKKGTIIIGQQVSTYQIVFVAYRRTSYVSDIAIDDVKLYNCSENLGTTTLTRETEVYTETVELNTAGSTTPETSSKIKSPEIIPTTVFSQSTSNYIINEQTKTTFSAATETSHSVMDSDMSTYIPTTTLTYKPTRATRDIQSTKTSLSDVHPTLLIASTKTDLAITDSQNSMSTGEDTTWEPTTNVFLHISQTNIVYEKDHSNISTTNSSYATTSPKSKQSTKKISINNGKKFTTKPHINNTVNFPNATDDNFPNLVLTKPKTQSSIPLKPLMIGVGVGVALGLVVVVIGIHLWMRNKRKKELQFADEMQPIAKSGSHEW